MYSINTQSTPSKPFNAPKLESIWATKSLVFLVMNLLTAGIYGSAETLSKKHRVKTLELEHDDLHNQAAGLASRWGDLETKLISLLDDLKSLNEEGRDGYDRLMNKFEKLSQKKEDLQTDSLKTPLDVARSLSEVALSTIAFLGQLIANIVTVGFYGVYQNYVLKNRIITLEAQNEHFKQQFNTQKEEKFENLQIIIDSFAEYAFIKEENGIIKGTDQGKAYAAVQQARTDLADLNKEHNKLQQDITALRVQKATVEQGKQAAETALATKQKEVQDLQARRAALENEKWDLQKTVDSFQIEIANNRVAVQTKEKEVADLRVNLNAANVKANRAQELQREIDRLQATQKNQPEIVKLAPQLGPIPPKYTAGPQDTEISGAMDIDDAAVEASLSPEEIEFCKKYNQRYGDKRSAAAVVEASFQHTFDELLDLAQNGDKIKFNRSGSTAGTNGEFAVYRYMILDMLKGAKLDENGCHGFQLRINADVSMLPSQPERVLQYKHDAKDGLKPVVALHYKQQDDFTPNEESLQLQDGVNAPAAKWILEQLSDEEMGYLFTHLMDPLIENQHPDYQKMVAFMRNRHDPRVKLVETASELIQDMATALHKKFGKNVLIPGWQTNADDWAIQPFVKEGDDLKALAKVSEITQAQGGKVVDWELDFDILADKRVRPQEQKQQEHFRDLLAVAQVKYKSVFQHLENDLLRHPAKKGDKFEKLTWKEINHQYYVSHQMIGADFEGVGGERCLFSNLLAVLLVTKEDLTVENVRYLKRAMAAYLEKLQLAKNRWLLEKAKPLHLQSKDASKLKEMAQLFDDLEATIKKTHSCTVAAYQGWLRDEPWGAAKIDISNLTPFEIQLCAYTLGIRIGLLCVDVKSPSKVDEYGRIVPEAEFYGPNTHECLLLSIRDVGDGKGGTYYSLFPKLSLQDNEELEQYPEAFEDALEVESYWSAIDMRKAH